MRCSIILLICLATLLRSIGALESTATGDDWIMFGRDGTRNAVSPETNPPTNWRVEMRERDGKVSQTPHNILWQADLGTTTFSDPVVANGLVWVGTNNGYSTSEKREDASVLACFRESDGKLLYRYVSPRLPGGRSYDWPYSSLACSPLIEGDRLWFTTNRCETVCLDIGPLKRGDEQPREVWKVDMMKQFGVRLRSPSMGLGHSCSIASYREFVYVITGNGVDETWSKVTAPGAPSVICLNKINGEVVWSDNSPGANILTGQWSSPLVIESGDQPQVVVPQGDGWLRSFEPSTGKLIWKFDANFKTSMLSADGRSSRNGINATPVFYDGLVYVATGQMAEHGEGDGRLVCIDPKMTGDISSELAVGGDGEPLPENRIQTVDTTKGERAVPNPNSGLVWEYVKSDRNGDGKIAFDETFHRSNGNVAIKNNLLVASDFSGLTHCLNAKTGKVHWVFDGLAAILASPLIVDDKIFVADEDGDIDIFRLSADPQVAMRQAAGGNEPLTEINMDSSVYCSPVYANGTLYIVRRDRLFAIRATGSETAGYWPQWRGPNRDNVAADWGLLQTWPEDGPPLEWRVDGIGQGIASVAIADGSIYTLGSTGEHEHVIALHETSGELRWLAPIGPAINDAPLMRWLSQRTPTVDGERLYVSTAQGDLICLQTGDGKELWRKNYPSDFNSPRRTWGFVDRPLVDGESLICTPGGKDATVAAFNKRTGELVWKCLLDPPENGAYAAVVAMDVRGLRIYVAVLKDSLVGISASDGRLLWQHETRSSGVGRINSFTPLVADDSVILPGGRAGSDLVLKLTRKGDNVTADEVKRMTLKLDHFQDSTVRLGDHLYAVAFTGGPLCVNWRTGQTVWGPQRTGGGKAAMTYADQRLYLLYANGTFLLAEATPEAYRQCGKFVLPDHLPGTGATFPVITVGRMYVRDNDRLFRFDLRANVPGKSKEPRLVQLDLTKYVPAGKTTASSSKNKQPDAIFVPTPPDVVAKMLELAGVKKSDVVYDLGSGDGRIVIAAAKAYGSKAIGIELDKQLVEQSLDHVGKAGVESLVQIEHADMFQQDLSRADVIAVYLPPKLLDRLLPQLTKLKPGTRIVSHFFKFTDIPPVKSVRFDSQDDGDSHEIHLWIAPLKE